MALGSALAYCDTATMIFHHFGYFWLLLATFGYFWLLLATFGYFWLLLATFGSSLLFFEKIN
jgi:hypothetical protein